MTIRSLPTACALLLSISSAGCAPTGGTDAAGNSPTNAPSALQPGIVVSWRPGLVLGLVKIYWDIVSGEAGMAIEPKELSIPYVGSFGIEGSIGGEISRLLPEKLRPAGEDRVLALVHGSRVLCYRLPAAGKIRYEVPWRSGAAEMPETERVLLIVVPAEELDADSRQRLDQVAVLAAAQEEVTAHLKSLDEKLTELAGREARGEPELRAEIAALVDEIGALRARVDGLAVGRVPVSSPSAPVPADVATLERLQDEVGALQRKLDAALSAAAEKNALAAAE